MPALSARRTSIAVTVWLALSLAACRNESVGTLPDCWTPSTADERDDVAIAAGAGATPTVSWTPACGAYSLSVAALATATSPGEPVWALRSSSGSVIRPGIRYGATPSGTTTEVPAVALVPGRTYRVTLFSLESALGVVGSADFTP